MNINCSTDDEVWQTVAAELEKHRFDGLTDFLGGTPPPPAAIITSDRYQELWQAVLAKCEDLKRQVPHRDTGRTAGAVDHDGRGMSAVLQLCQDDGTDFRYLIHAYTNSLTRDGIAVSVNGPWVDNHDSFWAVQLSDRDGAVVINHEHYRIAPDTTRGFVGFGGQLFRIRRFGSDEVIETRNLRHQGIIPPSWRDRLPDDAEFVKAETGVSA